MYKESKSSDSGRFCKRSEEYDVKTVGRWQ